MNSLAIQTKQLGRAFGSLQALDQLSIEVPPGIVFGFLGPNGSGKTTTIRLLLGLLEPTTGSAQVLGFDIRSQSSEVRQRCGALLEHHGLYERLSAEDNLDFFGRIWHLPTSDRRMRIQELLTSLGLWDRRKEIVGEWSRGMKQKLSIARALLHRPALLFLDEPTSGLDPVAAASLREDLQRLASNEGATIFLTTHNLAEAEKLCQQVAVIRQGNLLVQGAPEKLRQSRSSPRLEIHGSGFDEAIIEKLRLQPEISEVKHIDNHLEIFLKKQVETAPLVTLLVQAGVQVEEVRKEHASLEEVFLTLMEEEE